MKKIFMFLLISLLTCSACTHSSDSFQITDEISFSPLKKNDFIVDEYLYNNPEVLDFIVNEPDLYYFALSIKVTSDDRSNFTVKTIDLSDIDDYLSKYCYEIPEELTLVSSLDQPINRQKSITKIHRVLQVPDDEKSKLLEGLSEITLLIEILNENNELITENIKLTNAAD